VLTVGTVIGYLAADGESLPQAQTQPDDNATSIMPSITDEEAAKTTNSTASASPSIRRLARELGVALSNVAATGAGDRITDDDVRTAALKNTNHQTSAASTSAAAEIIATPRARRAATQTAVDLATVQGTGRNGRIREREALTAAKPQVVSLGTAGQRIVFSGRRKVIAERPGASHRQAVPVTLTS
jgi:pyruvate dehydrogenase E2 component (dihydrolipoamide acetyltransferase)